VLCYIIVNDLTSPPHRHPLHSTAAKLELALKDLGAAKNETATSKTPRHFKTDASASLRPVVVYGLSDACAAAQAALEQAGQELAMLSPTGVAHSIGPQWFKTLLANVRARFPDLQITGILDCGPYEGHVMSALHAGMTDVHFSGASENAQKLDWIAIKAGGAIHRSFKEVLDLKGEADQLAACRAWFQAARSVRAAKR